MKKIIALILVLMLALTIFVACDKDVENPDDTKDSGAVSDEQPGDDTGEQPGDSSDTEEEEDYWDPYIEGLEKPNYKGDGVELPIIPIG